MSFPEFFVLRILDTKSPGETLPVAAQRFEPWTPADSEARRPEGPARAADTGPDGPTSAMGTHSADRPELFATWPHAALGARTAACLAHGTGSPAS